MSNTSANPPTGIVLKPPHTLPASTTPRPSVFLAGSIDMGRAEDWQASLTASLSHLPITIYNPRRSSTDDDSGAFDGTWNQDVSNPLLVQQVEWELDALEQATVIAMYFDKDGQAPISLLELGLFARTGRMVVCCPEGYWRRGNVQIVCRRYGVEMVENLEELGRRVVEKVEGSAGGQPE